MSSTDSSWTIVHSTYLKPFEAWHAKCLRLRVAKLDSKSPASFHKLSRCVSCTAPICQHVACPSHGYPWVQPCLAPCLAPCLVPCLVPCFLIFLYESTTSQLCFLAWHSLAIPVSSVGQRNRWCRGWKWMADDGSTCEGGRQEWCQTHPTDSHMQEYPDSGLFKTLDILWYLQILSDLTIQNVET